MDILIKQYDSSYLNEVIALFVEEYKVDFNAYRESFIKFFEHPFQREKCIRIIAVDSGNTLMGFQSFFYWPYAKSGKVYNTYQSGSSIVSRKARGQGAFQKMLNYAEQLKYTYQYDFFMGFPVEASYKSFMSNGWNNPFNLQWYAKMKNPLGFLFSPFFKTQEAALESNISSEAIYKLENTSQFLDWRKAYQEKKYRVFSFSDAGFTFQASHKINIRKKIIKELIIGEVLINTNDQAFIDQAFARYRKWLFMQWDIGLLSYCTNNEDHFISRNVIGYGLKKIDKSIYFITKHQGETKPEDWLLFRSDIDTW